MREREGDLWRAVARSSSSLGMFQIALDDHGHLFTGHGDGALRIWDRSRPAAHPAAPAGAEVQRNLLVIRHLHDASISRLEVRGDTLFTFSADQTLRQWAIRSGEPRASVPVRFDDAAMSPNGLWIATVNTSPDVSLWDSAKIRLLALIPAAEPLFQVTFLDDDHVVVEGQNGHLEVIDVSAPQRTAPEVIRLVRDSPRWPVANRRVVEHQ